jgi:hypothetical protein
MPLHGHLLSPSCGCSEMNGALSFWLRFMAPVGSVSASFYHLQSPYDVEDLMMCDHFPSGGQEFLLSKIIYVLKCHTLYCNIVSVTFKMSKRLTVILILDPFYCKCNNYVGKHFMTSSHSLNYKFISICLDRVFIQKNP